jgi:hypothetical protein
LMPTNIAPGVTNLVRRIIARPNSGFDQQLNVVMHTQGQSKSRRHSLTRIFSGFRLFLLGLASLIIFTFKYK